MKKSFLGNLSISKILMFTFVMSASTTVLGQTAPPKPVEHLYSNHKDMNISDDFNSIAWGDKWTWRVSKGYNLGDSSYIGINTDKETYVSIRGNNAKKMGSGISSLHPSGYGFYVAKWRIKGVTTGNRTPWHPSIWSTIVNNGKDSRALEPAPQKHLEIDFMESFDKPKWGVHANVWTKGSAVTFELVPHRKEYSYPEWNIFGFEYTPEYIAIWEFTGGEWEFIKSIRFSSECNKDDEKIINGWRPNKGNTINYKHRQKMFWIFSNIYMKQHKMPSVDSELHLDYFYYYPFIFYPERGTI